jgi:hypothetical protein
MPLNPPSYRGQDVWYSPNVYVNKVPVALWQPPQVGDSLVFSFTLQPDATQSKFAGSVTEFWNSTITDNRANPFNKDAQVVAGGRNGQTIDVVVGDAPPSGATPENLQGEYNIAQSPLQLPPGFGPWQTLNANLDASLNEAAQGLWTDNSANTRACFAELGQLANFPNPWCAAYAGAMLKRSGISYLEGNLRAFGFSDARWGSPVPLNDYQQWRYNDLVVLEWSHVGFIRGIDLEKQQIQVIGGNQSDTVNQINYKRGSLSKVSYIARGWVVPPEVDKPIITTLQPGAPVLLPSQTR